MDIAANLTQHTIVLCVDKRERAIGIQALLAKAGFRVVMALSLYDALKYISQEMPHLVISESLLADGSVGTLYDRLQQHDTLQKTPIMVHVLKKTREELQPLTQRKFAGFFLGPFEPKAFLTKVREIIREHALVSPYFVDAESVGLLSDITISIEANVMGRSGEQVVSKSSAEVDPGASMLCVPANPDLGPAVFRMASNLRKGDEIFNLFPINRIVGKGRKWVCGLPEIKVSESAENQVRRVIFYDPNPKRYEGYREILLGYDIELIHARSLNLAAAILKRDSTGIGCVYLHELVNDASGIEWKNVYGKLSANQRPPIIVGTSSINARSTSAVRYIKRPFGMGLFVEMLNAAFERVGNLTGPSTPAGVTSGFPVKYQAQAKLLGIDETGGIMQIRFPLLKGSKLCINHPFFETAWEGDTTVQVVASAAQPSQPDIWHARFEAVGAGMSKVKYWDKVSKHLHSLTSPAPEAEAQSA